MMKIDNVLRALFLALVLCLPRGVAAAPLQTPYVDFPFDVAQGNNMVEGEFGICASLTYFFDVRLYYSGAKDAEKLEKLLGGWGQYPDGRYTNPGTAIPLHFTLYRTQDDQRVEQIFDATVQAVGFYAHGVDEIDERNGYYARKIARVALTPGRYKVQASTVGPSPAFSGFETRLAVTFQHSLRKACD